MKAPQMFLAVIVAAGLVLPTAMAGTQEAVLDVEGMTCGSCVNRIQAALKKVDGVREATVNLSLNQANVTYDASQVSRSDLVDSK